MIGRADIEGSKSNVAMNAWLPQASYPCGNFSDTSSFKFRRSKGSLGHAFTVRIRTGNQNQTSFYPSVPHEISVLVELILGHLRYLLTDVPPQPNSPPDNVFRPDRPAEAGLGSKKRGIAPLPIHGISKITLKVVVFHFRPRAPTYTTPLKSFHKVGLESSSTGRIPLVRTSSELAVRRPGKAPRRSRSQSVPRPARGDPLSAAEAARAVRRQPTGSGLGPPCPSPQSQSFSRGYGSILPTSLAYIVPSTRGCSPWRPDAVMSTTGRGRHSVLRIFKGRRGRTGHRATCGALPAAGPYLRLSHPHRRPLRPGSRPRFCSDRRALLLIGAWHLPRRPGVGRALKRHPFSGLVDSADERFARQYRCGPPPEFPLASPRSGIVHHLSGPEQACSHSNPSQKIKVGRRCTPLGGSRQSASLRLAGLLHPLTRTHVRLLGPCFKTGRMGCPQAGAGSTQVYRRDGACCQPRSTRRHLHEPIDSSGFGRRTNPHRSHAPSRSADRLSPFHIRPGRIAGPHSLPSRQFQALFDSLFKVLFIFPSRYMFAIGLTPTAPRGATGSGHDGALTLSGAPLPGDLGPVPPLRTLLQTTIRTARAVRFSSWADPGSLAVTKGILVHVHGSFCFAGFDNDPSAGSPTETLLRLLLPLNDKVQWNSRDVAGGEPPTVAAILTLHRTIQSVGATGGVYKGQGRSQRELMTRAY
ncbi:hypothetical protein L1887_56725 [Cichorium endivia]|nr:hypothetical protein L1887_56725 [Cichorium endivia]